MNEDYELRDWAKKFGVTPQQLKEAVQAVGNRAVDVEKHLKVGVRGVGGRERPVPRRAQGPAAGGSAGGWSIERPLRNSTRNQPRMPLGFDSLHPRGVKRFDLRSGCPVGSA